MAKKKTKIKEINPAIKFNVGLQKYEPVLPLRKTKENISERIDKKAIITFIIVLLILLGLFLLALKVYSYIS